MANMLEELERYYWVGLTGAGGKWVAQAILPYSDRVLYKVEAETPRKAVQLLFAKALGPKAKL